MLTSASFPPREGLGFYVWNLSRRLMQLGHQVQIITRGRLGATSCEVVDGIPIWRPPFLPCYPFHVHLHSIFVRHLLHRLESKVDLLHLHMPLVGLPATSLPVLVTVHTPMKADSASVRANTPLGLLVKLQLPVSTSLERQLFGGACRLTAVARSVAVELNDYGIDPGKIAVLGNGVDTEVFCPGGESTPDQPPYFLTAGRLGLRKGLEDLLCAAVLITQSEPRARFLIAGSGPLEHRLRRKIRRLGLTDHVELLGHISDRSTMVDLYRGATAYIHAAHYEGLPTVLLEAMASGTPTITTAVSGSLDVVSDGLNGLLVPPRSPRRLAGAVLRILGDPLLAHRLGAAARRTVVDRYSWSSVSRNYARQYERLLAGDCL